MDSLLPRILNKELKESKNLYPRYSASMTDIEIPMPKSYPSVCFCQNRLIHYHSAECQITHITDFPPVRTFSPILRIPPLTDYRTKLVLTAGSFTGRGCVFRPFSTQAMLRPRVRMVCMPSASRAASPG